MDIKITRFPTISFFDSFYEKNNDITFSAALSYLSITIIWMVLSSLSFEMKDEIWFDKHSTDKGGNGP